MAFLLLLSLANIVILLSAIVTFYVTTISVEFKCYYIIIICW